MHRDRVPLSEKSTKIVFHFWKMQNKNVRMAGLEQLAETLGDEEIQEFTVDSNPKGGN